MCKRASELALNGICHEGKADVGRVTAVGGAKILIGASEHLVVEGAAQNQDGDFFAEMTVDEHVSHYIALGLSKMDAIKQVAKDRGVPKGVIYKAILNE